MGNISKDFQYKFKQFSPLSLDKIKIEEHKEFSLEYNKEKAKDLYEQSFYEKDEFERLKLLEQSLDYNNVNEKVIIDYLKILQKKDKNKFKTEKQLYAPAISKKNFDSLLKNEVSEGEGETNPIEKLKEVMKLILNFNVDNIHSKHTIYQYFSIKFSKTDFQANVDFSFEDNKELYTFFLYEWVCSEISFLSSKIFKKIKTSNMDFQQKLKEFCSCDDDIRIAQKLKTGEIENDNIIIYLFSYFFTHFEIASNYISYFGKLIYYCLDNWNKETLYIFRYILNEMFEYINGNKMAIDCKSDEFIELDKYYQSIQKKTELQELVRPKLMKMIKIEGNNLIINIKKKVIILEDYNRYNIADLLNDILALHDYDEKSFNRYKYKYINIKYFNENNIIRACDKFISRFLEFIGKSKTILSLLNQIFPGYSNYENVKFETWLPSYLLNFYKKINFYKQHLEMLALTQNSNLEINYFFFVDNKENIGIEAITFTNVVVNLGFFIYSFYHESLGHLLIRFLNILTKMNYNSPRNENNEAESGQFIESLMFNERKSEYSIYELLYIIDVDNYKDDFKIFRKKFQCVGENYKPSQNFINMLKDIGLETEKNLDMIKSKKKSAKYRLGISNINDSRSTKYGPMKLKSCILRKEEYDKTINEFRNDIIERYGSMENYSDKILSLIDKINE